MKINHRFHAYLNTNAYNTGVGLFLIEVYNNTTNNNHYERVKNGLLFLKVLLLASSAIVS